MNNQSEEEKIESMKSYASSKYGREFTVETFQAAKDATYTNILSLSDGEHIFNVYQSEGYDASDDYPNAVINKKFVDQFKSKINCENNVSAYFMFANENTITMDYATDADVSNVVDDYTLLKIIVVVVVDERISDCAEELFQIYREVLAYGPKYIDFEVIQAENIGSDLGVMLKNLPGFYDNDWDKHSEVIASLGVTNKDVSSAEELIKGVK